MEFHIDMTGLAPDRDAIESAIHVVDPAAVVDLDTGSHTVRVSAWVDAGQLLSLVTLAGYPVSPDQVTQIPSTCCGGCSG